MGHGAEKPGTAGDSESEDHAKDSEPQCSLLLGCPRGTAALDAVTLADPADSTRAFARKIVDPAFGHFRSRTRTHGHPASDCRL